MSTGIRILALRRCFIYIDDNFFDFGEIGVGKGLSGHLFAVHSPSRK